MIYSKCTNTVLGFVTCPSSNRSKGNKNMSSRKSPQWRKMKNISVISTLARCIVQLSCVIVVFTALILNTAVASGSMEPTLRTGDVAIYNRLAYLKHDVSRGDIISFWSDECHALLSKRVIGIAGDEISFKDGYVIINGLVADESDYISDGVETNCTSTFIVPDNCVFVLGDNRENSIDSRFFANPYISCDDIKGKYLGTIPKLW